MARDRLRSLACAVDTARGRPSGEEGLVTIKRASGNDLHVADHSFEETALAIAKIVFPESQEFPAVTLPCDFLDLPGKTIMPSPEGGGIVGTDVFDVSQPEIGMLRQGTSHRCERRKTTAREDIALDEIH